VEFVNFLEKIILNREWSTLIESNKGLRISIKWFSLSSHQYKISQLYEDYLNLVHNEIANKSLKIIFTFNL
jgi:hypothetical protein